MAALSLLPTTDPTALIDLKKDGKTTIGVMTCGGDCPGLNAVIRAVVFTAVRLHDWRVIGIEDSMCGLIDLSYRGPFGNTELTVPLVDNIIKEGGTILGCSNKSDPFRFVEEQPDGKKKEVDVSERVIQNYHLLGLSAVVVIGGDGTMRIAHRLSVQSKGTFRVVGCPKTIDNDLIGTDQTFGFDTAVQTITDALDKIQDTARSHDRIIICEVMGRDSGWLALHGGIAGRADVICLPEIPYSVECILSKVERRNYRGFPFSIIVIAEGAKPKDGAASFLGEQQAGEMQRYGGAASQLEACLLAKCSTHLDIRVSVLGYIQRGGSPSAFDRVVGTRFGNRAVELIKEEKFGHLVVIKGTEVTEVPMKEVTQGQKFVSPDCEMVRAARNCGVCFGCGACLERVRHTPDQRKEL
mmetsp:Transcript_43750/g.61505  ORF Transcript_43750/g.61505 Transcript_43750/m.61505 type:complete len:411 (+) Transcript_43750:53-1285(+)|eukprot:CAMPEP_0201488240 /NCGR_PEP_ID=MMETSP0151_2-20130828/17841_1 /ASSEMBLY_ACC=CAM_ASM_000257 /TAXON_ID=200890 /ORGANISM="Paramoeba atlantica, Strain 621/1 / CCAP 1560/9" /LENGTH=410 /DNA_ID=CAMNT_0047873495 /DNA_START=46 /DNA_END=1278 /DNA_ORIENTATION=+